MKKSRALIYVRVSTEKQAQKGISLPAQEERCREVAEEAGLEVEKDDVYVDAGESARTAKRPALLDLLARSKKDSQVGAVIVYDVSRLARNRLDFALIKQVFQKQGIALVSATEPIDESPEGQMLEGVLSTVAEFFSAQSGRKISANMEKKARAGGWPNLAPYGYRNRKEKLPSGEIKAWIEPDPKEAPWVKRVFQEFASGDWSLKALARKLDSQGIPVRSQRNRKTKRFHHSHLDRMLRNRIYIGLIDWGNVQGAEGTHEPLIDSELFYRVENLLSIRSGSVARKHRHFSPLKGLSYCANCGSGMTLDLTDTTARTIRYFRCRKIQKGEPVSCSEKYFEESVYIGELEKLLEAVELPADVVQEVREEVDRQLGAEEQLSRATRARLEDELEGVQARRKKLLLRELEDETGDKDLYLEVKRDLDRAKTRLEKKLSEISGTSEKSIEVARKAAGITGSCHRAFKATSDPEAQSLLVRTIFERLELAGGKIIRAKLNPILEFFRKTTEVTKWPLAFPVDLVLSGAPEGSRVEARESCHEEPDGLHRVVDLLRPDTHGAIETCYEYLKQRNLVDRPDSLP